MDLEGVEPSSKQEINTLSTCLFSLLFSCCSKTETTNFIVHFENDRVSRWEGDYLAVNDGELAMKTVQQFGRNLARDKKKRR